MGYTQKISADTTGRQIVEFRSNDIENLLISADNDILWGYGDLSQALMPLPANNFLSISHLDFSGKRPQAIKIYARGSTTTANVYISYIGKPL